MNEKDTAFEACLSHKPFSSNINNQPLKPRMESPVQELKHRLQYLHPRHIECIKLWAMMEGGPDVIIWRKNDEAISKAQKSMINRKGLIGFAVTQEAVRFEVFDRRGAFLAAVTRENPPMVPPRIDTDDEACLAAAATVLKNPYQLAKMHPYTGAAVNIQANYIAIIARLLEGRDHEYHLAGTSWAAIGGGDSVFIDVVSAPLKMQNVYLDHMRALKNGDVIDWKIHDQEFYRASQSYRAECFCSWLLLASGSKLTREDVQLRISMLSEKDRYVMTVEALNVLLHDIMYFTGEEIGKSEILDPEAKITLSDSALRILS